MKPFSKPAPTFNVVLFVEIYKIKTLDVVDFLTATDVAAEDTQEAGENLGSILGRVLETKIELMNTIARLQSLQ